MKTMRGGFLLLIGSILLCSAGCHSRQAQEQSSIVWWYTADLDGDLQDELLVIDRGEAADELPADRPAEYGRTLNIYSQFELSDGRPVITGEPEVVIDLSELKPMKVMAGDINGDGQMEIGVCVYKTAKFHPVMAKRPFFYHLADGKLAPVWLGSRLARPFDDYLVADMDQDGRAELVAIEQLENGRRIVAIYEWKGFGFEVKGVSGEIDQPAAFANNLNAREEEVLIDLDGKRRRVSWDGEQVVIAEP